MDKYVEIIKLLEKIFGKSAVSKSLGTRTNVIRFPKGKQPLDPTTRHFDVEGSAEKNPDLVNTIKNSIEDRMGDLTKMNDQELLTYKQNLQRLDNYLNPPTGPTADVIEAGSKQRVTGEGLEKLIEEKGTKYPPTTVAGQLEVQGKKLEQQRKNLEEAKPKSIIGDIMSDYAKFQKIMQEENRKGLVRATARSILYDDIKSGKIKNLTLEELSSVRDPLDNFRSIYGEGALEQLDSLTDDFAQMRSADEAAKFARSKYTIEPKAEPVSESKTYEELEDLIKKDPEEPEKKADGGSIGLDYLMGFDNRPKYDKGGRVKKILDLITKANEELKGKRSMEGVNPKTGEVTAPKEPIKTARTTADIEKEIDELNSSPIDSIEKKRKYNELHLEFINSLDPRRSNKNLDYRRKTLDTENRLILKAEEKGLDFDTFEELRRGLYDSRKQKTLDFIKTGKVDLEPLKPVTTFEEAQERFKTAAKAADEIFPDYTQPKTAANTLAEVMAEQKYKKTFDQLSGDQQSELYSEAYNYITSINRLPKQSPKVIPEQVLEAEMNRVLNQYDKSMFIKNEQGLVDVTNQENQKMMAMLLKRDHPELYNQIYNLGEDLSQKQILSEFDTTGRKPNKDGGLNHLLGF